MNALGFVGLLLERAEMKFQSLDLDWWIHINPGPLKSISLRARPSRGRVLEYNFPLNQVYRYKDDEVYQRRWIDQALSEFRERI